MARVDGSRSPGERRPLRIASRSSACSWDPSSPRRDRSSRTNSSGARPDHSTAMELDLTDSPLPAYGLSMTNLTVQPTTALGELAATIRGALAGEGDWDAAADRVRAVLADPLPSASMLPAQLRAGSPEGYVSRPVHVEPDGSFSLVAFVCRQGQQTAIHDHVSWCVFAVLAGTPVEDVFALDDAGTGLVLAGHDRCPTGTVGGGAPP